MQVGRQNEGDAPQPVHHSDRLWLSGHGVLSELIGEVAIQVIVIAVVPSSDSLYIACKTSMSCWNTVLYTYYRLHSRDYAVFKICSGVQQWCFDEEKNNFFSVVLVTWELTLWSKDTPPQAVSQRESSWESDLHDKYEAKPCKSTFCLTFCSPMFMITACTLLIRANESQCYSWE